MSDAMEQLGPEMARAIAEAGAVTQELGAGGAAAPGAEESAAPAIDPVAESRVMWGMVFGMMDGASPQVGKLYPKEKREVIAVSWAALAQQEGWEINAIGGKWSVRIMFAFALIPEQAIAAVMGLVMKRLGMGKEEPKAQAQAMAGAMPVEPPKGSEPEAAPVATMELVPG